MTAAESTFAEETFSSVVVGYALRVTHQLQSAHYFQLERPAPNGAQWIEIPTGEQGQAVSFLLGQLRGKRVQFSVSGPMRTFRDQKTCHLRELSFGTSERTNLAADGSGGGFFVDRMEMEDDGDLVVYTLSESHGEFDRIVFKYQQGEALEAVVRQCFLGPRKFSFEPDEDLGEGRCTIKSLTLL